MRNILIASLFLLFVCHCHTGIQKYPPEEEVTRAVTLLMKGIEEADRELLDRITAGELIYGHSSGKVQNKKEFIDEIVGKIPLDYRNIQLIDQTVKVIHETAIVRHIFTAETLTPEEISGNLRIGNVLVWQLQEGKWKLLARQAYKQ
jgi:hypothetical protein